MIPKLEPNKEGIVESKVFAGMRLNITAMLTDDLEMVLADLQTGLLSKEYLAFAKNLTK